MKQATKLQQPVRLNAISCTDRRDTLVKRAKAIRNVCLKQDPANGRELFLHCASELASQFGVSVNYVIELAAK